MKVIFFGLGSIGMRHARILLNNFGHEIFAYRSTSATTVNEPGIKEWEVSFLRLIEKMTNGTIINISPTGTSLYFKPGILVGGKISHDCGKDRSVGYFLEGLLCLAPFGKFPLVLTLNGITNDDRDWSVDLIRLCTLRILSWFGLAEGVEFHITRRGNAPTGNGEIQFVCPLLRTLSVIDRSTIGEIIRIRGTAYTARVSNNFGLRMISSAKTRLIQFTPNVYIQSDHYRAAEAGDSPGYACTLVAESMTGDLLAAEICGQPGVTPEDLGEHVANLLLQEVLKSGCVDSSHQSLVLQLMVLCPEDVCRVRFGKLTSYTIEFLRNLLDFFGVTFKIEPDSTNGTFLLTCIGIGYNNFSKRMF